MANKNYVNPYGTLVTQYKDGLTYIIANYIPGVTTEEGLVEIVFNYLNTIYSFGDIEEQMAVKALTGNAINGYLNSGVGVYPEFRQEPVRYLDLYFERIEESMATPSSVKSQTDKNQIAITLGKASYEYWYTLLSTPPIPPTAPWLTQLSGNVATDTSDIPFWISATMFGSNYCYDAINADDSRALSALSLITLAGALVVNSGKILFRWVPKKHVYRKPKPESQGISNQEKDIFTYDCPDGQSGYTPQFDTMDDARCWVEGFAKRTDCKIKRYSM